MCSILGIFDSRGGVDELRDLAVRLSRRQRHRAVHRRIAQIAFAEVLREPGGADDGDR